MSKQLTLGAGFENYGKTTRRALDETTICRFRHLLELNHLGEALFQYVLEYLEVHGIKVGTGTIVDASIISAPASTKNKARKREPNMHQTKKRNQWFFGMKAHIIA